MMLKNIKLILVSIALILGCCHETMANASQKIVRVEGKKDAQYAGNIDNITEELCTVLTRKRQEEHSQRSMTSKGR
jgi:hypothetical protein